MKSQSNANARERIRAAEQSIRDRVNDPKLRPRLTKAPKTWNQIVSSLDLLGDAEHAIESYLTGYPAQADFGTRYLLAYGALQALFLQQDATIHLSEALGGKDYTAILADKRLKKAREIRNQAVGHPSKKDRSKPTTTHQIARISLGPGGFDMLTADEQGKLQSEPVDLLALVRDQREAIATALEELDQKLDEDEDRQRREGFKYEHLDDLFPSTLDYSFEKLYEAVQEGFTPGIAGLDAVKAVMAKLTRSLDRRDVGIEGYPGVKDWFREIQHPMQELELFLAPGGSGRMPRKTAAILVLHLRRQMAELKHMAEDIEEDWRLSEPEA